MGDWIADRYAIAAGVLNGFLQTVGTARIVAGGEQQHVMILRRAVLHGVVDGDSEGVVPGPGAAFEVSQRIQSPIEAIRIHREPVAPRIAVAGYRGRRGVFRVGAGGRIVHERGGGDQPRIVGVETCDTGTLAPGLCKSNTVPVCANSCSAARAGRGRPLERGNRKSIVAQRIEA